MAPAPISVGYLAKSEVDVVAEVHLTQTLEYLRALMEALYDRNPGQWRRGDRPSRRFTVERVFRGTHVPDFPDLRGTRSTASIALAFDPGYEGDRVLAFCAGLTSMIRAAYDDKSEFFVLDELDPQKLYNSARNVEIAAFKLYTERGPDGLPLLRALGPPDPGGASIERLFGLVIGQQDTLARIVAHRRNRTVRIIIQRLVGAVFLPI